MPIVLSGSYRKYYNGSNAVVSVSSSYATDPIRQVKQMGYDALVFTHGNFTRASSGSAVLGSLNTIRWSNNNQPRLEDRGEGLYFLTEGERLNHIGNSRAAEASPWSAGSSVVITPNTTSGPDGAVLADRFVVASGGVGNYQGMVLTNSGTYAMSFWAKHPVSGGFVQFGIQDNSAAGVDFKLQAITSSWSRPSFTKKLTGGGSCYYVPAEGRGIGSTTARHLDFVADLHQLESGSFPSSPIVVSGSSAVRTADILKFNPGDVPSFIRNGVFAFDMFPYFSSTETTESLSSAGAQQTFTLLSFGASDVFAITGSKFMLTASTGFPSGAFTSSLLSWNRHQKITVTMDAARGVIDFATVSGSNYFFPGPWSWSNTGLQIGSVSGSNGFPFFGQISNFRTAPPITAALDLFVGGTFARSTSGSYLISAPTDGSTAFIRWANPGERRIENRGDGYGNTLLLEGARTNYLQRNRTPGLAPWAAGATVVTTSLLASPDGANLATRMSASSGGYGNYQGFGGTAAPTVASAWMRQGGSGNTTWHIMTNGSAVEATGSLTGLALTYGRMELKSTGAITSFVPVEARNNSSIGGLPAGNKDVILDFGQVEVGTFPTSPIVTPGAAAVARGLETLFYGPGQYPASFCTRGFEMTIIFDASSAEINAGGVPFVLIAMSTGTHQFDIRASGAGVAGLLFESGVLRVGASAVFTFSRGQPITFRIEPNAGKFTISGATTGNGTTTGTGFSWPGTNFYIGTNSIAGASTFGRYVRYIRPL